MLTHQRGPPLQAAASDDDSNGDENDEGDLMDDIGGANAEDMLDFMDWCRPPCAHSHLPTATALFPSLLLARSP